MHARIEHLLSIRDGEPVAVHIADHVEQCPECSAELRRLSATRTRLQALPQLDAPADAWQQIQMQMPSKAASRFNRTFAALAAGALIMLSIIVALAVRPGGSDETVATASECAVDGDARRPECAASDRDPAADSIVSGAALPVADLVARSRQLDDLLQQLPERPRIERVSTAATIETIEQRVQWLDLQLSYASDSGLSEAQAGQLWRERVDLMDSLVKVRYAEEAGQTSF